MRIRAVIVRSAVACGTALALPAGCTRPAVRPAADLVRKPRADPPTIVPASAETAAEPAAGGKPTRPLSPAALIYLAANTPPGHKPGAVQPWVFGPLTTATPLTVAAPYLPTKSADGPFAPTPRVPWVARTPVRAELHRVLRDSRADGRAAASKFGFPGFDPAVVPASGIIVYPLPPEPGLPDTVAVAPGVYAAAAKAFRRTLADAARSGDTKFAPLPFAYDPWDRIAPQKLPPLAEHAVAARPTDLHPDDLPPAEDSKFDPGESFRPPPTFAAAPPPPPLRAPAGADPTRGGAVPTSLAPRLAPTSPTVPAPHPGASEALPGTAVAQAGLCLPDAVALAYRRQPRLRSFLESVVQARAAETIAFAPFLPAAVASYGVGAYDLNVGGTGSPARGGGPNFNFQPGTGALPVGLGLASGYELAEVKVQWLLTDFGRRLGRYRQAQIASEMARLQTDRAFQTVAADVATAYHQLLKARALAGLAAESAKRADADLAATKELLAGGQVGREAVLRAEVRASQARAAADDTAAAADVALAALNLAVGVPVTAHTEIADVVAVYDGEPDLEATLTEALARRPELAVASKAVHAAQQGSRAAKAEFRPRVVAEGRAADFQQNGPRGHSDLVAGQVRLEWSLFEGGRRVGELRIADSQVRAAAAQAEALGEAIAFQVTEAHRQMGAARRAAERAGPAAAAARETYRLVRLRFAAGEGSAGELADADAAAVSAERDAAAARYDYLLAVARLNFAVGRPPVPGVSTDGK